MAILIPRKKEFWLRPPTGKSEINFGSSLATNLTGFYLPIDGGVQDLVNGGLLNPTTTTTYGEDQYGRYVKYGRYIVDLPEYQDKFTIVCRQHFPDNNNGTPKYAINRVDGTESFYASYINGGKIVGKCGNNSFIDSGVAPVAKKIADWMMSRESEVGNQFAAVVGSTRGDGSTSDSNVTGTTQMYLAYQSDINVYYLGTFKGQMSLDEYYNFQEAPYQVIKPRKTYFAIPFGLTTTATLTGTATASITEADITAGGKTIILTLANDTWVAAGASFDLERQGIINGLVSAQAETNGWNNVVQANEVVTAVVRTSDTIVTITLTAH